MAYGINLYNNKNEIMYSTDFMAYHFLGKYTATNIGSFKCQATFSCFGVPMIFIDGNFGQNSVGLIELKDNGSGSWTATVAGRTLSNVGLTSIDIYVFAFPTISSIDRYSIVAKNSFGQPTLNLEQRLLKISGIYQTTFESGSTTTVPNKALNFGSIPSDYIISGAIIGEIISPAGANGLLLGASPYRVNSSTVGVWASHLYSPFGPPISAYRIYEQQYVLFAEKSLYQ